MTLPEEISEMVQFPVPYIRKLENGNLMLAEKEAGKYISPDNGETWESEGNPWKDTAKELYVTDMAISPEGAVTMLGIPTIKDSGEGAETGETSGDDTSGDGEGSESETGKDGGASEDGEAEEMSDTEAEETSEKASGAGRVKLEWKYYYFDAEENETALELPGV